MTQLKYTGGARIGMSNATWPFANLTVTKDRLDLNASILGNYTFKSGDIISIEPYSGFMSSGLKINHKIPNYKDKVIFWTFKNPNEIINQIKQTGFLDNITSTVNQLDSEIIANRQKQGGFPIKIPFAISVVVIWNILFLMDFLNFSKNDSRGVPLGNGAISALGLVFLSCVLTLISKDFRKLVLREGRELKDIINFLYFLMLISGLMMISLLTFPK